MKNNSQSLRPTQRQHHSSEMSLPGVTVPPTPNGTDILGPIGTTLIGALIRFILELVSAEGVVVAETLDVGG